ncbi:MAG: phosphate/phosphite/phosphonate ABC transporter substrate-binding protein [bacterium]
MSKNILVAILLAFLCVSCGDGKKDNDLNDEQKIKNTDKFFTIGSLAKSNRQDERNFQPLARYIAAKLFPEEDINGRIIVADNFDELTKLINNGEIDLYIDSPYPMFKLKEKTDLKIILAHNREGIKDYHSVLLSSTKNNIKSLNDLKDRVIAFDSPFSTTGYFIPKVELLERGFKLVELDNLDNPVPAGSIGYIFTYSDDNTLLWILKDKTAAGATDNLSYQKLPQEYFTKYNVLLESEPIPRQIVAVRNEIPVDREKRLIEILCQFHTTAEGKDMMSPAGSAPLFEKLDFNVNNLEGKFKKLMEKTK